MNVVFFTASIHHYRVSFFEKLSATIGIKLLVARGRGLQTPGRPALDATEFPFPTHVLRDRALQLGPYTLRWQSGSIRLLNSARPDVIVIPGMCSFLSNWLVLNWARRRRVPVIMWTCGWEPQRTGSLSSSIKHLVSDAFYARASHSLLYSSKAYDKMLAAGLPKEKLTICYNGIELDGTLERAPAVKEAATELRQTEGVSEGPLFLYVGGILREKRLPDLLCAFQELRKAHPQAKLWIVGDGPELSALKTLAAETPPDAIKFWGRIVDGVESFFAAADFFVLPGTGGLGLNQAMLWGTPCICATADGTEDDLVMEPETGFRFQSGNPEELQAKMRQAASLLHTPDYARMAKSGETLISERSNVDSMVDCFRKSFLALAPRQK